MGTPQVEETGSSQAQQFPDSKEVVPAEGPETYIHDDDDESLHEKKIKRIYR